MYKRQALGWAVEWALVGLAPLLALYALAALGLIPKPDVPYDPGRFAIGPMEVLGLLALAAAAVGAWWALGLRRIPAGPQPATLGAAAAAICLAACAAAWLVNPFLALAMAPLPHVVMVHGTRGRRPAALAVPAALIAAVPMAAVVLSVAAALGWGGATPWQLVVLIAGGGLGLIAAAAIAVALAAVIAIARSALRSPDRPVGAAPQAPSRGRP